jgi:hypothetical protein
MDESYLRRLVHVKALTEMALQSFEKRTPSDMAQAVLTFDNALEMMFRLVLDTYPQAKFDKTKDYLPGLLDAFHQELPESPLKLPSLKEMHTVRNKIQHNGIIPHETVIERYRNLTLETLEYLSKQIFGKDWKDISLAELIQDSFIRDNYLLAENLFNEGMYADSAYYLVTAFENAKQNEQFSIHGSGMLSAMGGARIAADNSEDQGLKSIYQYAEKINEEVEVLKLRLDYKAYIKYRSMFGTTNPFEEPMGRQIHEIFASVVTDPSLEEKYANKPDLSESESHHLLHEMYRLTTEKAKPIFIEKYLRDKKDEELRKWIRFALEFVLESTLRWERLKR